jgi:UDP-N-acetylmuramoylalanine--D-glutamate ligase
MKIAILGYGDQGRSAYDYWNKPENQITICDQNPVADLPPNVDFKTDGTYLSDLHEFDVLVRTPGLHPDEILQVNIEHPEVMDKVSSVTNEFMRVCPAPIIGVTGTKGKGTTSSLIAGIVQNSGRRVHLGGNIGVPPLDLLKNNIQPDDIVVLELANFQLIDIQYSPHIAVCLMVSPEHLNWHKDMPEYVHAKRQMFVHQQPTDLCIFNSRNLYSEEVADVSPGIKITYDVPPESEDPTTTDGAYVDGSHIYMSGEKICSIHDVVLPGRHNLENVCAAIAATWEISGRNKKAIQQTLKTFTGLPHRLQVVRDYNGVLLIDDSFGTTPETAIVAIEAYKHPKVLIVGGSNKGASYEELVEKIIKSNVKHIVAIGEEGPKIVGLLQKYQNYRAVPCTILDQSVKMLEIVGAALKQATKGDVVILSPACASFDMFQNYKERGEQYQAAVKILP